MNFTKTLIDFMVDIATDVFSTNGKPDDPYDVNYTNHYVELHHFEENCGNTMKRYLPINKIIQDRKNKSITAKIDTDVDDKSMERVKSYCSENNIELSTSKNKINSITISKNTKGVLEEREWKKQIR